MDEPSISFIGQHHFNSQLPKKCSPQWKLLKEHENSWNAYYRRIRGKFILLIIAHEHFFSLFEEIRKNLGSAFFAFQLISITDTTVEGFEFASDGYLFYVAVVGAMLVFKGFDLIFAVCAVKSTKMAFPLPFSLLHGNQRSTYGTSYIVVLRNRNLFPQDIFEGSHYTLISGNAS